MRDKDTKDLELLYEAIKPKEGPIDVASWKSHTDNSITHILTYNPETDTFIDQSVSGSNIVEQKEVDGSDIEKYSKWYDNDILRKMSIIRQAEAERMTVS